MMTSATTATAARLTLDVQPAQGLQRPSLADPPKVVSHPERWVELDQLGGHTFGYAPTYEGFGEHINAHHRFFAECPAEGMKIDAGVPGWLRRGDALKLYEMAYFARGDILELGCYQGLSTSIQALAMRDAGRGAWIETIDLGADRVATTEANLAAQGLAANVRAHNGDAGAFCRELVKKARPGLLRKGRRFAFAFVDHSHEYGPMVEVCSTLAALIEPGGFCLFHDFDDRRNRDPEETGYGVGKAVMECLTPEEFQYCGTYGCAALYRRTGGA